MAPPAARRANPVQRSGHQGLRGNPDACHPRRGSACNKSANRAGGDARFVFALSVQPTAAVIPRFGGCRGFTPGTFFSPISLGGNGGARRVGGAGGASDKNPAKPPSKKRPAPRGCPGEWRVTAGRPYGWRAESSRPTEPAVAGENGRMISAPTTSAQAADHSLPPENVKNS